MRRPSRVARPCGADEARRGVLGPRGRGRGGGGGPGRRRRGTAGMTSGGGARYDPSGRISGAQGAGPPAASYDPYFWTSRDEVLESFTGRVAGHLPSHPPGPTLKDPARWVGPDLGPGREWVGAGGRGSGSPVRARGVAAEEYDS